MSRDARGWRADLRIPFSQLRFHPVSLDLAEVGVHRPGQRETGAQRVLQIEPQRRAGAGAPRKRVGAGGRQSGNSSRNISHGRRLRNAVRAFLLGALRAPGDRDRDMARPAEQPVILQPALAAAVGDRHDVVRFPTRPQPPPGFADGSIARRRLRARPLAVRLDHIETAEPADSLVALLHLLAHIPWAAADLPLVDAGIAAERPPRRLDGPSAPPAHRCPGLVEVRLSPLLRGDDSLAQGAHKGRYRPNRSQSLGRILDPESLIADRESPVPNPESGTGMQDWGCTNQGCGISDQGSGIRDEPCSDCCHQ